jgi:hypothetical protein
MAFRVQEKSVADQLDPWALAALNHMYATKNPDGSLGHIITNGPQGREWYRYFKQVGLLKKAAYLASCMRQDRSYMVPTEWPEQYDDQFKPSKDRFKVPPVQTAEERAQVVERFNRLVQQAKAD